MENTKSNVVDDWVRRAHFNKVYGYEIIIIWFFECIVCSIFDIISILTGRMQNITLKCKTYIFYRYLNTLNKMITRKILDYFYFKLDFGFKFYLKIFFLVWIQSILLTLMIVHHNSIYHCYTCKNLYKTIEKYGLIHY